MRATIVGAPVSPAALESALASLLPGGHHMRRGSATWVALPLDVRRDVVERLSASLGVELVVVEVEMSLGGRGADVMAGRRFVPSRGPEEDLTEDARELLHEWTADAEGGLDEDQVVLDLAWDLIDDEGRAREEDSCDEEAFEDRWANALVARLVATGELELRGKLKPNGQVAHHLQDADDSGFGARLLEVLISCTAVAEVYADENALEVALRETRPAD